MSFQRSILVAIATLITVGMTQVAFAAKRLRWLRYRGLRPDHLRNTDRTAAHRRRLRRLRRAGDVLRAERCGLCRAGRPMGRRLRRLRSSGRVWRRLRRRLWRGYGGGYSGCGNCGAPAVYTTPAPLYVVNQGPAFEGPGLMVPYHSYAPPAEYAPPPAYPATRVAMAGGYGGLATAAVMRSRCTRYHHARRLWRAVVLPSASDGAALLRRAAHDGIARTGAANSSRLPITKCEGPRRAGLRAFGGHAPTSRDWRCRARARRRSTR